MYKKIIKTAKEFSLTAKEKDAILSRVSSFMEENPVGPVSGDIKSPYVGAVINSDPIRHKQHNNGWSQLFILSKIKNKTFMRTTIITALILMLGGSTAFAANSSLPGDTLYPVKVHINENLRSAFTVGAQNKADYEAQLAQTRLQEAETLAARGQISDEQKADITVNFNEHAKAVAQYEKEMNTTGKTDEAASTDSHFKAMLSTHDSILTEISQNDSKNSNTINDITGAVGVYLTGHADADSKTNVNENTSHDASSNSNHEKTDENANAGLHVNGTLNTIINNDDGSESTSSNSSGPSTSGNSSSSASGSGSATGTVTGELGL
jgi:hypothetical protein